MNDCLISFGSNIGNSAECFRQSARRLENHAAIQSLIGSDTILTPATGGLGRQPPFLNGCFRFHTSLTTDRLYELIRLIESDFGRERRIRWGERTIDLDLLLFDGLELVTEALTIPHPRMSFRRFVLEPASQIAADMVHPTSGRSISQLLDHLNAMPDHITLASNPVTNPAWIMPVVATICQSSGWEFNVISQPDDFQTRVKETKLLVFSTDLDPELHELARRFPGPTLDLGDADRKTAGVEVQAAVEAMQILC